MTTKEKVKQGLSSRFVLNLVIFALMALIIYTSREDIVKAWNLLWQVNLWVLFLIIPVQFLSYFAHGMMTFSYLRGRGKLEKTSSAEMGMVSLELNFMNHIVPSGGVSGATYMVWRLGKMGVSAGQATMSQLVDILLRAAFFAVGLALALFAVTITNAAPNWVVLLLAVSITTLAAVTLFAWYIMSNKRRMMSFASQLTRFVNKIVRRVTFNRKKEVLNKEHVTGFFVDIVSDFETLKDQKELLTKPAIWCVIFNITDIMLFAITFWALGSGFDPAMLFIAYVVATVIGGVIFTPGGIGGFEVVMIAILAASGMDGGVATSGVILARVILVIVTLLSGYIVYHRAIKIYGKPKTKVDLVEGS